jgi:alkanesulfonate monooxygenase SsuD/methylene tetrahydromethanopterin reductase-like flavin-dependent oxidoreductase (luciferase family)
MRTGVAIPTTGTTAGHIVAWARAAEERGFDSLAVAGRVVHDSYEPLVAMSLVAAATRRVELITHVEAGPLRHRGVLARQAATLSRASSRRLTLGVGPDQHYALGEGTRIVSEHLDELGGRPILVAGNPRLAARVLSSAGSGWIMTSGSALDFAAGYLAVHDAWAWAGRPGRPRGIALLHVDGDIDALRDQLDAFQLAGADDVLICTPARGLAQLDRIAVAALRVPALA